MTGRTNIFTQRSRIDAAIRQFFDRKGDAQTALAAPAAFKQRNGSLVGKPDARAKFLLGQAQFGAQCGDGQCGRSIGFGGKSVVGHAR